MSHTLLAIGVMTGNSMDAADAVLTCFSKNGAMEDLAFHSRPFPRDLYKHLQDLRKAINEKAGDVAAVAADSALQFQKAHDTYLDLVAQTIRELITKAHQNPELTARFGQNFAIDIIGNHGQTLAHFPPSIVKDVKDVCTVQLGDGAKLADQTGLPVVFDFRSDDVMNGGEGAPFAPQHNKAMAVSMQEKGAFPIAFCNAGNTGNIALISSPTGTEETIALGWDTGPFNYFSDQLCQREKGAACDFDGSWGKQGKVSAELLHILFHRSVVNDAGSNYLLMAPPKSSDGQWYKLLPELMGEAPIQGKILSFEDRLRTAQYFSAYLFYHTLSLVPQNIALPRCFALFGGGWNNPVQRTHFKDLVTGAFHKAPLLPEHQKLFASLSRRLSEANQGQPPQVEDSAAFGFDGASTEARIFAHAAVARIQGHAFSYPETTGCAAPTLGGLIRFPRNDRSTITPALAEWLNFYGTNDIPTIDLDQHDLRWSRAARGWRDKA